MPVAASRLMAPVGDGRNLDPGTVGPHPHDGPAADLLLDLRNGEVQRLALVGIQSGIVGSVGEAAMGSSLIRVCCDVAP